MHTDNLVGRVWLSTVRSAGDRWHVGSNWDIEGQQISPKRRKPKKLRFIATHIICLSVTPPGKFPVAGAASGEVTHLAQEKEALPKCGGSGLLPDNS